MLLYKAGMDGDYVNTKNVEAILEISLRQEYLKSLPKGLIRVFNQASNAKNCSGVTAIFLYTLTLLLTYDVYPSCCGAIIL